MNHNLDFLRAELCKVVGHLGDGEAIPQHLAELSVTRLAMRFAVDYQDKPVTLTAMITLLAAYIDG